MKSPGLAKGKMQEIVVFVINSAFSGPVSVPEVLRARIFFAI